MQDEETTKKKGKKKKGKKAKRTVSPAPRQEVSAIAAAAFGGTGLKQAAPVDIWAPPKNVCENYALGKRTRIAMDKALGTAGYSSTMAAAMGVDGANSISFIGYPALAMLQQNPIMRLVVDTITDESVREWVTLQSEDEQAKDEDIKRVQGYLDKWHVKDYFKNASQMVGFQGGCLLFLDMGVPDEELITPLTIAKETIRKGSFKGFRMIEPMLVYPGAYEASNPLSPDYFCPETWIVLGKEIHTSRFLYFANNTLSTILRPAYNFFGIPLVQLMLQYVANFESARDASAEIVNNFSLLGLSTNMGQSITGGPADDIVNRVKLMLGAKRNSGVALIDKATEQFFQLTTPLNGLRDLVAQQLELIALISGEPVTKLFGTSPAGLNATGEGDANNWHDKVATWQNKVYAKNFTKARHLIELSESGAITSGIVDHWESLEEPDKVEAANIRKIQAETAAIYLDQGVILQEEERERLINDDESGYSSLSMAVELPAPVEPKGPGAFSLGGPVTEPEAV